VVYVGTRPGPGRQRDIVVYVGTRPGPGRQRDHGLLHGKFYKVDLWK